MYFRDEYLLEALYDTDLYAKVGLMPLGAMMATVCINTQHNTNISSPKHLAFMQLLDIARWDANRRSALFENQNTNTPFLSHTNPFANSTLSPLLRDLAATKKYVEIKAG